MEAINTKAMKGIKGYLERRGFEILEENWAHGGDSIDFIANEKDDLVFIGCQLRQNSGEGFPEEVLDRDSLERMATSCLTEHLDSSDCTVRFDLASMLILNDSRALLHHHRNALSEL
ncbi:YraN family protein [Berryella wangjianweii]|uniref:YraN family protein n=1 Tax=Berryella wangjianweii TaxID=2734634 RepID=A0A6M8J872_9ACTN|nr:YraN family protein [Berryella wangjianweii]QKF07062.1 YraN family protein [Berryella wangjianweii]